MAHPGQPFGRDGHQPLERHMTISEFAIPKSWVSDRRGPARWVASHAARHKIFIAGVFFGAFSNAALAAVLQAATSAFRSKRFHWGVRTL